MGVIIELFLVIILFVLIVVVTKWYITDFLNKIAPKNKNK